MVWGAQTRKPKPRQPKQTTWGAQTKPSRGEVVQATEDGEVWYGSRRFGLLGKEKP